MNETIVLGKKKNHWMKIYFYISLTASIIFLMLVSLAHYYAIENGYDWQYWELSELVYYGSTSEIIFMIAVMIYSLCLLFVLIPMRIIFSIKTIRTFYLCLAILLSITLFLVGAITERIFPSTHYIFGALFFILASI
ncbi:MAG: hypothetical protein FK734_20550, partial [Asgard group archaeon]|nr:hypothetical protein [Asgard group archaeon]